MAADPKDAVIARLLDGWVRNDECWLDTDPRWLKVDAYGTTIDAEPMTEAEASIVQDALAPLRRGANPWLT